VSRSVEQLTTALEACDLVVQGRLLPELLRQTQLQTLEHRSVDGVRQLAVVAYAATFFLRNLGELDLAVSAAQRMMSAAQEAEDPTLLGFAAYAQAHSLVPAGAVRRASELALSGAELAGGNDPELTAARGSCLLVASSTSSAQGDYDTARELIHSAKELAATLTAPTVVARHTSFSSWNAAMHRVAVEVEAGQPAAALEAAGPLMTSRIGQRERMSYFWVDVGRAYSQLDRHREAVDAFRRAERAAPLRVRLSPVVRDSVRELVDGAVRRAAGVELRGLAERCGVLAGD
jgi:tetratricopeptide (TPR) repeat protein